MKKFAWGLLLVPALATAAVKIETRARCGEDIVEKTFVLTQAQDNFYIENSCGLRTVVTLKQESAHTVDLDITITKQATKTKESVDCSGSIKAVFGEPVQFKCPSCVVDAELQFSVSQISEKSAQ